MAREQSACKRGGVHIRTFLTRQGRSDIASSNDADLLRCPSSQRRLTQANKKPGLSRGPGFRFAACLDLKLGRLNRQLADTLAGGRKDRAGKRGGESRQAWFADPARGFRAFHDVNLDLRHLVHAQHLVVVKVRLLDFAVLESDLAVERGSEPVDDRAFNLT